MRRVLRIAALVLFTLPLAAVAADEPAQRPTQEEHGGAVAFGAHVVHGTTLGLERVAEVAEMPTRAAARAAVRGLARQTGRPISALATELTQSSERWTYVSRAGKYVKVLHWGIEGKKLYSATEKEGAEGFVKEGSSIAAHEGIVYASALAGAKLGTLLGPEGTVVGGCIGALCGAIAGSYGYEKYAEKHVKDYASGVYRGYAGQPPEGAPEAGGAPGGSPPARGPGGTPPTGPGGSGPPRPPVIEPYYPPPIGPSGPNTFETTMTMSNLVVTSPGNVAPGGQARFAALVTIETRAKDSGLVLSRVENQDVTGVATWTFSAAGAIAGPGAVQVDCGFEGATITATATLPGVGSASSAASVGRLALSALTVSAAAGAGDPGSAIALSATGTYANSVCTAQRPITTGIAWSASEGASAAGMTLTIDPDKDGGIVSVSGAIEGVRSNTVTVAVIPPRLLRIAIAGSSSAPVCTTARFELTAFYSNRPDRAKPIPAEQAAWSFGGRYTLVAANAVRADWPDTVITVSATYGGQSAQSSVTIGPIGSRSPNYPLDDVTIETAVEVGGSLQGVATMFTCDGGRAAPGAQWSSSAPEILACSTSGACTGMKPGKATVTVSYLDHTVTRTVTVNEPSGGSAQGAVGKNECVTHADCPSDSSCQNGRCVKAPTTEQVLSGYDRGSRGGAGTGSTTGTDEASGTGERPGRFGSRSLDEATRDRARELERSRSHGGDTPPNRGGTTTQPGAGGAGTTTQPGAGGSGTTTQPGAGGAGPTPSPGTTTPAPTPTPTPPPASSDTTKAWWGYEIVYTYKREGTPCTNTTAGTTFGTRAEATEARRQSAAETSALLRSVGRTEVTLVRQQFFAGPVQTEPKYPGKTGSKCS